MTSSVILKRGASIQVLMNLDDLFIKAHLVLPREAEFRTSSEERDASWQGPRMILRVSGSQVQITGRRSRRKRPLMEVTIVCILNKDIVRDLSLHAYQDVKCGDWSDSDRIMGNLTFNDMLQTSPSLNEGCGCRPEHDIVCYDCVVALHQ